MLRAVGWRRRRVVAMILGEAMLLCLLGGTLGCALAATAVSAINRWPSLAGFLAGTLTPALFGQALLVALRSVCWEACTRPGGRHGSSPSRRCVTMVLLAARP